MAKKHRYSNSGFGFGGGFYGGGYGGYSGGWSSWYQKTTVGDLKEEMTGTTSVFGRDKGISVEFKGDKAVTGDGTVTFPNLDDDLSFDQNTVQLLRGWVDSEAAIARYSDRKFIHAQEGLQESNPLLYDVFKAVESSRVENNYTDFYPGAGKNLAQLSDELFKRGRKEFKNGREYFPVAISMFARSRMKGVFNYMRCNEMAKIVDKPLVESWVDEIQQLTSAQESFELARKIVEEIENQPQPQPQQQSGQGQGQGDGDQNQDGQGKGEEGDGNQKDGKAKAGMGDGKYTSITIDQLIDEAIQKAKKEHGTGYTFKQGDENSPYLVYTTEHDVVEHWSDGTKTFPTTIKAYVEAKTKMDAGLATAKRKLELMIQATQKISWDSMKERGRLDSKQLVAAYQGEQNVFKIKRDESDLDTAVSVLVDMSGSMAGDQKAYCAFLATIVFGELLSKIGVPFEITGFTTKNLPGEVIDEWRDAVYGGRFHDQKYARVEALHTMNFKKFGDRYFDARKYLGRIANHHGVNGANADGESVSKAAKSLLKRPEKRKILLVLSDGQPAINNQAAGRGHLKRTVKELERHMDVVGIGICSHAVTNFYTNNIVIHDARNLPETMLNLLKSKLLPSEKTKKTA